MELIGVRRHWNPAFQSANAADVSGEKASIAAKSAIHASLHYLNKTIFNDTKPFEKLTTKTDDVAPSSDTLSTDEATNLIANTREVFVCLLRAFNCAHDLILENQVNGHLVRSR